MCCDRPVTVLLRPWNRADALDLAAALAADPLLERQVGDLPDLAACEAAVDRWAAPAPDRWLRAVVLDGRAVGAVGVGEVEHRHGTGWVHYWLAPSARGRGLAVRAVVAACDWAFQEEGLFRLELGHRTDNPASCRVATSAGFRVEGLERDRLRYGAERYDVERHARLRTDQGPGVAPLAQA